ncbi:hypothetical protein B7760_01677 [Burkholderia glumae]|nr:hypothetical protein B7760_01677 [Burkholderia glumae]
MAVRALQPHRQAPAFAGAHHGRGRLAAACDPRQPQPGRKPRKPGLVAVDLEHEAQARVVAHRQAMHDAGHDDVAPLPFERQRVGEPPVRTHGGIREADQHRQRQHRRARGPSHRAAVRGLPPAPRRSGQHRAGRRHQRQLQRVRQHGLPLQQHDAERERDPAFPHRASRPARREGDASCESLCGPSNAPGRHGPRAGRTGACGAVKCGGAAASRDGNPARQRAGNRKPEDENNERSRAAKRPSGASLSPARR